MRQVERLLTTPATQNNLSTAPTLPHFKYLPPYRRPCAGQSKEQTSDKCVVRWRPICFSFEFNLKPAQSPRAADSPALPLSPLRCSPFTSTIGLMVVPLPVCLPGYASAAASATVCLVPKTKSKFCLLLSGAGNKGAGAGRGNKKCLRCEAWKMCLFRIT